MLRHSRAVLVWCHRRVGSIAVALLARAGFTVIAATGKAAEADYLKQLGATDVIDRGGVIGRRQADAKALGRCRRSVGSHTPGQRLCPDPLRWRDRRLRPRPGYGFSGVGGAVHPARRVAARYRQRDGARPPRLAAWNRLAKELDPPCWM